MSKYMWRGALIGFLMTLVLGGILFAFGPESANSWAVGKVSIAKAVLIPTFITALIGMVLGLWLVRLWSLGNFSLVRGFLIGSGLFPFFAIATAVTLPFLGTLIISLVHLPGVLFSNIFSYPLIKYLRGPNFLIAESHEPLIAWTDITVSWLGWGFIGGLIGRLKKR